MSSEPTPSTGNGVVKPEASQSGEAEQTVTSQTTAKTDLDTESDAVINGIVQSIFSQGSMLETEQQSIKKLEQALEIIPTIESDRYKAEALSNIIAASDNIAALNRSQQI
ncbi:MAG: hypothetical protein RH949_09595 [Coleofasciculus sp. A1-SPW-01]|uniref:hypothetical protein n=1 Tax=Coleofasciculus sp. A1-SPW-01 TaxID=3070819 RepID=UPI0033042542